MISRVAACLALILTVTGCGSSENDGTQAYDDTAALSDELATDHDIICFHVNNDAGETGAKRTECMTEGHDWTISIWDSAEERDLRTSKHIAALTESGQDYCLVIGRGEGAWSVNAEDPQRLFCKKIATALGVARTVPT